MTDHEIMLWIPFVNREHLREFHLLPTIYGQILNLRENLGSGAVNDFELRIPVLVKKGLVRIGGCGPDCHASHLDVTPAGRELVKVWNREGCQVHWRKRSGRRDCKDILKNGPRVFEERLERPELGARLHMRLQRTG